MKKDMQIFVITSRRSKNVMNVIEKSGTEQIIFVVRDMEDMCDYFEEIKKYHGKHNALENYIPMLTDTSWPKVLIGGGLCESRNACISHCVENEIRFCVQISDDLKKLVTNNLDGKNKEHKELTVQKLAYKMIYELSATVYALIGLPPTDNPYFATKDIQTGCFIVGDFMVIDTMKGTLLFDENLKLKEDYDYTLQHIKHFGNVLRYQSALATFEHYTNKGGAVDYRNSQNEQNAIKYLHNKWGEAIKLNPKRENEILLNVKNFNFKQNSLF